MRDYVILDALIHLAGDNATIDEIVFGAIGPIANNARGPAAGHTRYFQELIQTGGVEIDALFRRGYGVRACLCLRGLIWEAGNAGGENEKQSDCQNSR